MNGTLVEALGDARRIHVDSMTLIYFIEEIPRYVSEVESVFRLVHDGRIEGISSTVTLLEVLVHPIRKGDSDLVRQYRNLLIGSRNFTLFPVDQQIAEIGARIRAEHGFKSPDAIQLATAVSQGAGVFLSNDRTLKQFEELTVLFLDDYCPDIPR